MDSPAMNSDRSIPPATGPRALLHGVDWAVRAGAADEVMLGTRRRLRRRRHRLVVAGSLLALTLGGAWWFPPIVPPTAAPVTSSSSAVVTIPERRILPDSSIVELKEGSEISVAYTAKARRVALGRGEAHFSVMKDATRPFIVAVGSVEVRAVGTSFSVQR